MRVGVVCPYDLTRPGGVQRQVEGLVGKLREWGDDAWAVAPGCPPALGRNVGSSRLVLANASRAPLALHPAVWRRVQTAVADAEVCHIHEPLMPLVSPAALSAGVPAVATFHAAAPPWAGALYRAASPLARRLLAAAAVRTAVSEVAAAVLPAAWGPVEIVPNAIPLPDPPQVERVEGRVVFVGRDEPRKGLSVLLEAWPQVRRRHPEAELVVVGASRPDPLPGVRFLGRVPEEEKWRQLAEGSVAVAPNTGGESFGIVVAEAMAAGAAAVVSDLPAFRAVAADSVSYAPPGDREALAAAISRLLDEPELRARLAEQARARAQRFSWEVVAARYRELYRRAAAEPA